MEPMQWSVKNGRSINAIGEPNRVRVASYSHIAGPHPCAFPTPSIVLIGAWYSSQPGLD